MKSRKNVGDVLSTRRHEHLNREPGNEEQEWSMYEKLRVKMIEVGPFLRLRYEFEVTIRKTLAGELSRRKIQWS